MATSVSGNRKIVLKGDFGQHEEGVLNGAASPGMNLSLTNAARVQERDSYAVGSTDNAGTGTAVTTTLAPIKIVKEDALQGKSVDGAYASGDTVLFYIPKKGDVLQVLVASGQTIAKKNGLTAGTNGKWVADATNAAVEALESTAGALAADTLVRVRVL